MKVSSKAVRKNGKPLKISGVAKYSAPKTGSLVIDHVKALQLILAAETTNTEFTPRIREELPAIVSHWL